MEHLEERAALLRIKECDLRLDAIHQCDTSVDRGIHIGGAYSALPPMTALYYGGMMYFDVKNPTAPGQDLFILSKGHAVAALASVYADVGYISRECLENSRGWGAVIKGHPGPCIPGVPVATGPLGHGISLACGYALTRKERQKGNVFCLVGDGELQEGSCWEGAALAADRHLSNLCILVDKNSGQSDSTVKLSVGMDDVAEKFRGFGYRVLQAASDDMEGLLSALEIFTSKPQGMQPTAIICHCYKGLGGYGAVTGSHKAAMSKVETDNERVFLGRARLNLIKNLNGFNPGILDPLARGVGLNILRDESGNVTDCRRIAATEAPIRAKVRDKALRYDPSLLPALDRTKAYGTYDVAKAAMAAFAHDERLYTVDSDLSNASGLCDGAMLTNRGHAINVGIAECNMLCVAEALASEGGNVWTSTFPPFFDMRALRRIAVSWQERQEAIDNPDGWLNTGHNLDITFMATSANLETAVNGATHMGNDDMNLVDQLANIKVLDVGCPQLLQAVMKWIAEGGRGLVYLRTMKTKIPPIYPTDFRFEYGKGYTVVRSEKPAAVIVSSGHGTVEAINAASLLKEAGISAEVIDMVSFDGPLCEKLLGAGVPILFAEQNNGALFHRFSQYVVRQHIPGDLSKIYALNTTTRHGGPLYIQSGTYEQLLEELGLTPRDIATCVQKMI